MRRYLIDRAGGGPTVPFTPLRSADLRPGRNAELELVVTIDRLFEPMDAGHPEWRQTVEIERQEPGNARRAAQ